jgi:4-hydroxy-tetrahydrodipicolinate synthase
VGRPPPGGGRRLSAFAQALAGTLPGMIEIRGVLTAMVTPFDDAGAVDEAAARRVARHLLDNGSHGLVVAGTTGESPTLSDEEKIGLLRAVRDEAGAEATIIAGTGSNDTRHTVELTAAAAEAGADAALVVTPYYNKPNPAGIRAHIEAAAKVGLPVVLYNIPSRVVVNIPPRDLAELATIENVVAVKQANDDELGPIEGLDVLAGNDTVFLRTLEFGGAGGILVSSHVAGARMRQMWDAAQAGDLDRARGIDAELQPIYAATMVAPNPAPIKAALEILGVLDSARLRLPLVEATEAERAEVRAALETAGLLAKAA